MVKSKLSVHKEIKPYLDDIAEKLWTNHATIMVGAGFSKNSSNKLPDWNQLGDIFFEKLYGKKPNHENTRYRNVLKLADEVEAAFSRPTLHHILTREIPDISIEPVKIHQHLLELPWIDVFTTNYDTLLERAAEKVSGRRYDVVVSCQELVYSSSPRIIKLHGSFPSTTPFIITEEDYRKYPSDFAPFVNTVQQALLENTLCLIGFSGDDPNFLKWIGWIRDNLGAENSPPIYLIGLFELTNAELKLLNNRNIVVINMGTCEGINANEHGKALELFFNYLKSKDTSLDNYKWPRDFHLPYPDRRLEKESVEEQIIGFTKQVQKIKSNYPGWLIAPREARIKLKRGVNNWLSFISINDAIKTDIKIQYLNMCVWVLQTSLQPLFDDQVEVIEDLILGLDNNDPIHESLIYLKLALCRYYRDEFKWNNWQPLIEQLKNTDSPEFNEHIAYEQCLGAFHKLELAQLGCCLKDWQPKNNSPLWLIRKASLMAEYGNLEDAIKLSQEALTNIRSKLNLSPVKGDVSLLSLESYAMVLFRYASNADDFKKREVFAYFTERWEELKLYKCDPWAELEYFDLLLQKPYQEPTNEATTPSFDIGFYQTTTTQINDKHALDAVSYFRLYEDSGLPIRLQHTTLNNNTSGHALTAIAQYYPLWSIFLATRLADNKVIKSLLGRKGLFRLSRKDADIATDIYLQTYKDLNNGVSSYKGRLQKNLYDRFASILPEILSRLMSRLPFEKISVIYQFTCKIFAMDTFYKYDGLEQILKRAPQMVSEKEALILLPHAIKCQCPNRVSLTQKNKIIPPIWEFDLTKINSRIFTKEDFDYWISLIGDVDKHKQSWGFYTLVKLHDANLLNRGQKNQFVKALWGNVQSGCLPEIENILDSAYIDLPAPITESQIKRIVKNKIFNLDIPIRAKDKSYSGTKGYIPFFDELLNCYSKIDLSFKDIESLFIKLLNWWDQDKNNLNDDGGPRLFGTAAEEFRARFENLVKTLEKIILPRMIIQEDVNKETKANIIRIIQELEEFGFNVFKSKVIAATLFNLSGKEIASKINKAILSKNINDVVSACDALDYWVANTAHETQNKPLQTLATRILFREPIGLIYCIQTARKILKHVNENQNTFISNSLSNTLIYMKEETQINEQDTEASIADKLSMRKLACQYASDFYNDSRFRAESKESLIVWGDTSKAEIEFNEIRRIWS